MTPTVRCLAVRDLGAAVQFYEGVLGFELEVRSPGHGSPCSVAGGSPPLAKCAGRPWSWVTFARWKCPSSPEVWNRLVIEVADLGSRVEALQALGVTIRTGISAGVGVLQVLSGRPIWRTPSSCSSGRPGTTSGRGHAGRVGGSARYALVSNYHSEKEITK